jgi:hypothetical protein
VRESVLLLLFVRSLQHITMTCLLLFAFRSQVFTPSSFSTEPACDTSKVGSLVYGHAIITKGRQTSRNPIQETKRKREGETIDEQSERRSRQTGKAGANARREEKKEMAHYNEEGERLSTKRQGKERREGTDGRTTVKGMITWSVWKRGQRAV